MITVSQEYPSILSCLYGLSLANSACWVGTAIRQIDDKGRALVKLAFRADRSTLRLDELAGDRQSQAAAGLAALVAAPEVVEDIWQIFSRDTLNLLRVF